MARIFKHVLVINGKSYTFYGESDADAKKIALAWQKKHPNGL